jgi:hypothetical protein
VVLLHSFSPAKRVTDSANDNLGAIRAAREAAPGSRHVLSGPYCPPLRADTGQLESGCEPLGRFHPAGGASASSTATGRELHTPTACMTRENDPYSLGNGDGQRPNPRHTRLLQGIEADNHSSEGGKYLRTSRYFSCQRDRCRLVSHLIFKFDIKLRFEKPR